MPFRTTTINNIPTWIFSGEPDAEFEQIMKKHMDSSDMPVIDIEVPPTEDEAKICINKVKQLGYVPLFVHIYPENTITVYVRVPKLVCLKKQKK